MPNTPVNVDTSKLVRKDVQSVSPAPAPEDVSTVRAPLSPVLQTETDTLGQLYGNLPVIRHAPFPPSANTASNAAATSTAQTVSAAAVDGVSITLKAPKEITVQGSPAGPTGTFRLSWTPEEAWEFFAAPAPPNPSQVSTLDTNAGTTGSSGTLSTTVAATTGLGEWIMWMGRFSGNTVNDPGSTWTPLFDARAADYFDLIVGQEVFNTVPVTGSATLTGGGTVPWASLMAVFGSQPTIIQHPALSTSFSTSGSITGSVDISFDSDVKAGNTILVVISGDPQWIGTTPPDPESAGLPVAFTASDNNSDIFQSYGFECNTNGFTGTGTKSGAQINGFIAQDVAGGPTTVTVNFNTHDNLSNMGGKIYIFETTPMVPVFGTPGFRRIVGQPIGATGDLPLPTATNVGAVAAAGPVSHEWVASINTDGSITLTRPTFPDVSGNIALTQLDNGTNASATTYFQGSGTLGAWVPANFSPLTTKTSSYTVLTSDFVVWMNSASATTVTLPIVTDQWWRIKNINTGVVTVEGVSGQIEGQSSITLGLTGQSVDVLCDGTNFRIL